MADKKRLPKKLIVDSKDRLIPVMREQLQLIGDKLVEDLMRAYRNATPSQKVNAYKNVSAKGTGQYVANLRDALAEVSARALKQARSEVPKAKKVEFAENTFDSLPKSIQKKLKVIAQLTGQAQVDALLKATFFAFSHNVDNSSGSESILEAEIQKAADNVVEGAAIEVGATNAVSSAVNETRNAFFFEDDVLDEVESFTFTNGDPVSEICQDLAGRVFDKNDPEAEQYFPPLHHNCKSYLVPNLKGSNKKVDPRGLTPSSEKAAASIKFEEKNCGVK